MIKINLLSEGRKPVTAKKARFGRGGGSGGGSGGGGTSLDPTSIALLATIGLGLLLALGYNFLLGREVKDLEGRRAEAQAEVDRLAPIIEEVEQFKAKKAKLENKVQIIGDLKANQQGPVQIMDMISRALPELLWLDRLEVVGTNVTLTGQAFNTNAVANFIENLDRVPEFHEPILMDASQASGASYRFRVRFNFTHTPSEVEEG